MLSYRIPSERVKAWLAKAKQAIVGDDDGSKDGAGPGPSRRRYLIAALALLGWFLLFTWLSGPTVVQLGYSGFKTAVEQDLIARVTFKGDAISGRFVEDRPDDAEEAGVIEAFRPGVRFESTMPRVDDPQLLPLLERRGVEIFAESPDTGAWGRMLMSLVPWILILGAFLYISWRMQQRMMGGGGGGGAQGGILGFGKSKAKRFREQDTQTTLDDVAGLPNAKADLAEIIDHLSDPRRFRSVGATMPKGVLLVGPPGTGKTMLARAVAGEAGVPFYSISGSEFVEMFVGVGASRVRDLFDAAKKEAPCVIFIDEIDAVGRTRGAGVGGGHDEREQTLNQILSEMDGFTPQQDIIVLAATNRPDVLDQALLRPGRFDRKVHLELPGRDARREILAVHAKKIVLGDDVDLDLLAARTVGFSGADLQNLVNEAALLAGRERRDAVDMSLFDAARDKLVLGAERDRGIGDEERRMVAYHECGHALLAWLLPNADALDKVTVIPRGRALGATEQLPEEERRTFTESYLKDRIGVMLGGRIAEQLVFGEVTNGAQADLSHATELARRMVCRWGMSEAIGPVALKRGDEHVFLGREMAQSPDYSDATAKLIDDEVKRLISGIEDRARELMQGHRDALETIVDALLEAETLGREDVEELLRGQGEAADSDRRAAASR
ncbi:MAG: ATP-dependent zinc metalloprotease FtsH [Thiohalocapsa sp.]|nr:ATP-dependent zinc metalloprotease FtsH [Thiohalocapsa sp.]